MNFPFPTARLMKVCAEKMSKKGFQAALGRLIMKNHPEKFGESVYIHEEEKLAFHSFFDNANEGPNQPVDFNLRFKEICNRITAMVKNDGITALASDAEGIIFYFYYSLAPW